MTGVIGIMKDNITKVLDRGERLEHLEERSGIRAVTQISTCDFFLLEWRYEILVDFTMINC